MGGWRSRGGGAQRGGAQHHRIEFAGGRQPDDGAVLGLSMDLAELHAVAAFYRGIDREPTDVELETLAQTWSEHCSHKTFRALITTPDGTTIAPLLKQLRDCTDAIAAPFVVSAFVGNAGIVRYSPGVTLAVKAETHNHPSAIEPFGGSNTGVGGVIRDVMGAAHHPIAVTDILCFGPTDLPAEQLPEGVLHPRLIESGVIAGVDYVASAGSPGDVANMSLGGGASASVDLAVQNVISDGVVMAVAAGNDGLNACNYSPARAANAITVGSTTSTDARSTFSNTGSCVDIFAPGS